MTDFRAAKDLYPSTNRPTDLDNVNIELRCYFETQQCHINNKASPTIHIDGYALVSNNGSLNETTWHSIHDAVVAEELVAETLEEGAESFTEILAPSTSLLAELNSTSAGVWGAGDSWSIGRPFGPVTVRQDFYNRVLSSTFYYTTPGGPVREAPIVPVVLNEPPIEYMFNAAPEGAGGSYFYDVGHDLYVGQPNFNYFAPGDLIDGQLGLVPWNNNPNGGPHHWVGWQTDPIITFKFRDPRSFTSVVVGMHHNPDAIRQASSIAVSFSTNGSMYSAATVANFPVPPSSNAIRAALTVDVSANPAALNAKYVKVSVTGAVPFAQWRMLDEVVFSP